MDVKGKEIFLVGIKGTGMASLAVLLSKAGAIVSGCDTGEVFSTDSLLKRYGINYAEGFEPMLLGELCTLVIHSSAYPASMPILAKAKQRNLSVFSYPAFLAHLSTLQDTYAVAGTHGKTTTCSVASHLLGTGSLSAFPLYALFGSAFQKDGAFPYQGEECALFEACEYQDHFLSYQLRGALVTNVEYDHPDYFVSPKQYRKSFETFVDNLAPKGFLICCSDDEGSRALYEYAKRKRSDLTLLSYGFADRGPFGLQMTADNKGICLSCLPDFPLPLQVQAKPLVDDHIGALVLALAMILDRPHPRLYLESDAYVTEEIVPTVAAMLSAKLATFRGIARRCEVVLEEGGVVYLDDYAHHPTEIEVTLAELRMRYPHSSLVVVFAAHTASRTEALLPRFVHALGEADYLVLQPTYASARLDGDTGDGMGHLLYDRLQGAPGLRLKGLIRCDDEDATIKATADWLQEGSLCITMGAGNNASLGKRIAHFRRSLP